MYIIAARLTLMPRYEVKKLGMQAMSDWSIQAGSRVLVHAGSSGVGTWVVQIAKVCGHVLLLFLDLQHVPCSAYGGITMKLAQNSSVIALCSATSLPYVKVKMINYLRSAWLATPFCVATSVWVSPKRQKRCSGSISARLGNCCAYKSAC